MALSLGVCLALVLAAAPPAIGQEDLAPQDYTAIEGLSQPVHDTVHEGARVEMRDGVELALDVVRPAGDGRWPIILELSPYLGVFNDVVVTGYLGPDEDGQPVHLQDFFPPRGYVVVHASLRGTGRSTGCLDLLGPTDRADAVELVEWLADQPWSDGRVGMAGHSYSAMAAIATAAEAPPSLVTIVSNAGSAAMYHHQFQQGVPHDDLVLGPLLTYQSLSTADRIQHAPDKDPTETGCEWPSSTALHTDHVSGVETAWHRDRDARAAVAGADIPIFATFGTADGAVDLLSLDWVAGRGARPGDKLWIGQWDHGYVGIADEGYPYPNDREEQWRAAVHAWFDHHLQARDVPTGPPTEVFLNDGRVLVERSWPIATEPLSLYPRGIDGLVGPLSSEPGDAEVAVLHTTPWHPTEAVSLAFETDAAAEPLLLLGTPHLRLRAAVDRVRVNLVARLYDVGPDGRREELHVRGFAINPELRDGVDRVSPVVPGEVMDLDLEGVGIAHRLLPGHRLRLEVSTTGTLTDPASKRLPLFGNGSRVEVHLGGGHPTALQVPVLTDPVLWPDPRSQ